MNFIINLFIFLLVLFLYVHLLFFFKKGNQLEIFELNEIAKDKLEDLTNIKQPIIFNNNLNNTKLLNIYDNRDKYKNEKIKIYNSKNLNSINKLDLSYNISFYNFINLINKNNNDNYLSFNNKNFLKKSNLIKILRNNDSFLIPPLHSQSYYDIILGSINSISKLGYSLKSKNYIFLVKGKIKIKLIPYKYTFLIPQNNNYCNMEFSSDLNLWNPQKKYSNNLKKIKMIEIDIVPGKIIYIPAFWWFSFKIIEEETIIISLKYSTYINDIANLPLLGLKFLQEQNIKYTCKKVK